MTNPNDATPEFDLPPVNEPRTEDEFLKQESYHAREALSRLRGEILESLSNTADVSAWTERYPWQSLAAAITAGLTAGVAMGKATRKTPPASETASPSADFNGQPESAPPEPPPHASAKLAGGLATLLGMVGSTVAAAATQAIAQVVKDSIHNAMNPEPRQEEPSANDGPAL